MAKKIELETIPYDAKIKLEIPGSFYARIQQLVVHYSQSRNQEELVKALERLKNKEQATSEFEYHIQTLTILVFEIEQAAKEQNLLKKEELEVPDNTSES